MRLIVGTKEHMKQKTPSECKCVICGRIVADFGPVPDWKKRNYICPQCYALGYRIPRGSAKWTTIMNSIEKEKK